MKKPPSPHPAGDDRLFADPLDAISGFRFDDDVATVFADMIERSVPGYATVVGMSGLLAARFATPGSHLYDLGCSLGATTFAMARALGAPGCRIIAVDNAPAMTSRLADQLERTPPPVPVEVVQADIVDVTLSDASVVALNYTLQFVPTCEREALLQRIHKAMRPGGVLILSEKVRIDDAAMDTLFLELHHEFKRRRGYSDLEISQKRTALENVLVPESLAQHRERLMRAGFDRIEVWFKCFNFASLIAFARDRK
jgi:tRNA (cmo5U34)-methyltransferase